MKRDERKIALRCAVYTRVSTDSGLEQDFNSLDNQREASEAYCESTARVDPTPVCHFNVSSRRSALRPLAE
jgi:DNA invertase Pin-like site-specific DNA recombinase